MRDACADTVGAAVAAVDRVPVAVWVAVREEVAVRVGMIASNTSARGPAGTTSCCDVSCRAPLAKRRLPTNRPSRLIAHI